MTNEQYHKSPALSCSGLKHFIKSPAHYLNYRETPPESTPAMELGSYIHSIILEPETVKEYAIQPEGLSLATKDGKEWKANNEGKTIIKYADHVNAMQMLDQVINNQMCKTILSNGIAESSIFWTDEESGVECRCRPDYINAELKIIVDLKTTIDASPEAFTKSAWSMQYHLQAAFYQRGVFQATGEWHDWLFIAIEKGNPYLQPVIYKPDAEILKYSDMVISEQLMKFAECQKINIWEGYSENIQTLSMPTWAKI